MKYFLKHIASINWLGVGLLGCHLGSLVSSFSFFSPDFLPSPFYSTEISLDIEIGCPQLFNCLLQLGFLVPGTLSRRRRHFSAGVIFALLPEVGQVTAPRLLLGVRPRGRRLHLSGLLEY